MQFNADETNNSLLLFGGTILIWFCLFWFGIALAAITSSGWVIFGCFVTWIISLGIGVAIFVNGEELVEGITDIYKAKEREKKLVP